MNVKSSLKFQLQTLLLLLLILLSSLMSHVQTIVWLRNVNQRGPAAVEAGTNCLTLMVDYYFYNPLITRTQNMVILHTNNMSSPSAEIEIKILELMHTNLVKGNIQGFQLRIISDNMKIDASIITDQNFRLQTDYYILVADSFEKFHYNMKSFVRRAAAWTPGAKFLILFNNPDMRIIENLDVAESSGEEKIEIDSILHLATKFIRTMLITYNAVNVIVLFATSATTYNIYMANPYRTDSDCDSLKPILLDICHNGKFKTGNDTKKYIRESSSISDTIPSCKFIFCARVNAPYIEDGCENGLEMEIVKTIQSVMKFQITIMCTTMNRGEFKNGNWTNLLGMLINDKCDFLIGGFYPDNEIHYEFDVTVPYLQDTFTWYVNLPKKRDTWKGLITIFESETWLLFLFILILSTITWYFLGILSINEYQQHKHLILCILNSWAVFIGLSANNRPLQLPLRIFFILLALYGLNVTTIYTSKLITVFTETKYERQLETINQILDAGIPIGGREESRDWFDNDYAADRRIFKLYNYSSEFEPTTTNLLRVIEGKQAMLINRVFILSHHLRNDMYELKGNVFSNPMEMIGERGFPILSKFNTIINYMKDSGLIAKINHDFLYKMTILNFINHHSRDADDDDNHNEDDQIDSGDNKIGGGDDDNLQHYYHRNNNEEETAVVLSVKHLYGAFASLIIGLSISCFVFCIELFSISKYYLNSILNLQLIGNWLLIKFKLKEKSSLSIAKRKYNNRRNDDGDDDDNDKKILLKKIKQKN